ncbi:CopG family transcriptional regulator [Mobilicoccus caccae]|uniref:Ribbon-helix-helix protein, copG family n=1 Tax=Mobilicoccus caccae TaxID=1859295 RepID=A0ABQ6IR37_9MICO|nr:CopG family transcriptional regulator [Mobilicoccus caccae]GMA40166.1 hypothetical protein GCM10025883_22110 [Mobilicoccus caccae]
MTLRLDPEQDAKLTELAAAQGISKQQAVLRLIDTAASRATREERLRAIAQRVKDRDGELLDRLAQ